MPGQSLATARTSGRAAWVRSGFMQVLPDVLSGQGARSHADVVRSAAAFGRDPDDVLRRVLDVAGLAVHAVLRVDLQPVGVVGVLHVFVDAGGAVAAFRAGVYGQVHLHRDCRIL